jgi:NlpC/P60 family
MRSLATRRLCVTACLAAALAATGTAATPAAADSAAVSLNGRGDAIDGEAGTGMPAPPSVYRGGVGRAVVRRASVRWSDVGRGYWARNAIDYVGAAHGWMRDYPKDGHGRFPFRPTKLERRKFFFRSAVEAFAPPRVRIDRDIRFSDLSAKAPFYRYANIAVKLGWLDPDRRTIEPNVPVTMATVHRVLVLALGLNRAAAGLNHIHTADGRRFDTWKNFGTTVIGMRLGLRYNHSTESLDVTPNSPMPRSEVAWSVYRAKTVASYTLDGMSSYENITLPRMDAAKRKIIEWGIRYAGYPYVWGGEWYRPSGGGYCCGPQPVGGFDCSGLTWWLMKAQSGTWDPTPPRHYRGWSLPQRASRDMAAAGKRIGWGHKQVGDLLFYDGTGDGVVDHVDTYAGNGWALDSSSGSGGVTFMWVGSGWYRDHFKHARRITG